MTKQLKDGEPGSQGSSAPQAVDPASAQHAASEFKIVGIGASAGGLAALKTFFGKMPPQPGVAFVVVVHLSPQYKSHLPEVLQPHCPMPVQQVTETVPLEPNRIYVIPPNANLDAVDTHLRLSTLEQARPERAPIDHFFRTLAETNDGQAIGVVLSGTGSDGTLGLRRIKEHGGVTIAQDPSEAEYDGMPRTAVTSGVVDVVLPVAEIPIRILEIANVQVHIPLTDEATESEAEQVRILNKVFAHLRTRTGHDFSEYKRSTIMRRIGRRMQVHQLEELSDYLELLRDNRGEVMELFDELLITVTEFFRDAGIFERLEKDIIPQLFEGREPKEAIRIWSVGCATGEEAYSLAMLLLEEAGRREVHPQIQIFASDLHDYSLRRAREGVYSGSISADVSPERLRRFFIGETDSYRVRKEVRELVIFAAHDLLKDPPFSHLDLIVCRNVLIYLQRDVQEDVITLFHYALNPDGLLLLGTAETVETSDLFACEDKALCLYRRRSVPTREPRLPAFPYTPRRQHDDEPLTDRPVHTGGYGSIHAKMVEQYAPPSIFVNDNHEVVHYSAHAGRFLQIPGASRRTTSSS